MIYIASRYTMHDLNNQINDYLRKNGLQTFLPEHIGIHAYSPSEKRIVAERCKEAIRSSSAMLIVSPYGNDVSFEVGYAVAISELDGITRPIILYNPFKRGVLENDDMVAPHIDCQVTDLKTLVERFKQFYRE